MSDLTVGPGTQVTLHFTLKLSDGAVVDTTVERDPATFVVGDGNLLPGFEKALFGLAVGAKDHFVITPEDGFGRPNPNNIQHIPRREFPKDMELTEGLMVSFADAQNAELPGVIARITDEQVDVDFNHPLAGRDITFEVEILDVSPGTKH